MNHVFLTPPELAKHYGVKPAKVLTWIETGELEAVNMAESPKGRPRWRISREAIESFERRRSSRPLTVPRRKRRKLEDVPNYI